MKEKLRTIIAAAVLAVAMLSGASAVNATVTAQPGVVLTPYNATGEKLTPDGQGKYTDPAYYTLTYTNPVIKAGEQYLVLIVSGEPGDNGSLPDITASTLQYINQTVADNGSVIFDEKIYPKALVDSVVLVTGKAMDFPLLAGTITVDATQGDKKDITGAAITLDNDSWEYTGSAIRPTINTIAVNGSDKALVAGVDYDAAYTNNVVAGTATVTVTGKGDYTGTTNKTFSITKNIHPTLTLGNLNQQVGSVTPVTATLSPADATAQITITYGNLPGSPNLPTAAGSYIVTASFAGNDNVAAVTQTGTLTITEKRPPQSSDSSGGGGGGGGSSSGGGGGGSSSGSTSSNRITSKSVTGGKISYSPQTYSTGDKITVTATPLKGYGLARLIVKDSSGKEIPTEKIQGNVFTFKMPSGKVTVDAEFVKSGDTDTPESPDTPSE